MTSLDDAAIREAWRAGWNAAMNTLNPSQRSPCPGAPPLRDGIRAPLPDTVRTPHNLTTAMNELRGWAGAPSLRELAIRTRGLPRATLHDAITGRSMPKPDLLHAFVKACGAQDDWPVWFAAWRRAQETQRKEKTA